MKHKYGWDFTKEQMADAKTDLRGKIFFLLLCVDPKTKFEYQNIDVEKAFDSLLRNLDGYNKLFNCPVEIVRIMCLLEAALDEYRNSNFQFSIYRKLILDAGSEVLKIKEVE